ncbi:MAG: hypothetical protein GX444_11275 [Myxococcales bacterium]|nr:hypothetical protein [Myxococcales bacterium]
MATVKITATIATQVQSLVPPDEDRFDTYFPPALENISSMVAKGKASEQANHTEFAELRRILTEQKDWVIGNKERFETIKLWRESFPRSHWWWWMEEL